MKYAKLLIGRQTAFLIQQHFSINDVERKAVGDSDLCCWNLVNDDLKSVDQSWDETLMATMKIPDEDFLDSLCSIQLMKSSKTKLALEYCKQ